VTCSRLSIRKAITFGRITVSFVMKFDRRFLTLKFHFFPSISLSGSITSFSCTECQKTFESIDSYKLHEKMHMNKKDKKCPHCYDKFKTKKLKNHILSCRWRTIWASTGRKMWQKPELCRKIDETSENWKKPAWVEKVWTFIRNLSTKYWKSRN
jgi:hypothetical protein